MTLDNVDAGSEVVRLPQRVPFTMVDNPIIRSLSDYVALGLYVDLLSLPPGWRINLGQLARTHKQGRTVLTAAMNDLIARGLVFRVRYQDSNGHWKTRTYVCSTPVTAAELRSVRDQYRRCQVETTTELSEATAPRRPQPATANHRPTMTATDPANAAPSAASGLFRLVAPGARFPALGAPTPGSPEPGNSDPGPPTPGQPAPHRPEAPEKIPPPPPGPFASPTEGDGACTEGMRPNEPDLQPYGAPGGRHENGPGAELAAAVAAAWPTLGRRDLATLQPLITAAQRELPHQALLDHLTANPGGAKHPAGVLRSRLANLPPPRPTPAPTQDWCGDCTAATYRWIQDADGRPLQPCPTCSPQAVHRRRADDQPVVSRT